MVTRVTCAVSVPIVRGVLSPVLSSARPWRLLGFGGLGPRQYPAVELEVPRPRAGGTTIRLGSPLGGLDNQPRPIDVQTFVSELVDVVWNRLSPSALAGQVAEAVRQVRW
jgi:hypothetical protein